MSKSLALAGPFAAVLLAGGCGDTMISISTDGRIEVAVSTTGAGLDLDGFSVSVDGGVERIVPSGGAVTLTDLREGSHSVRLSGLGDTCRVEGSNPRSVVVGAGGTAAVVFEVRCTRGWSRRPADPPIRTLRARGGGDPDPAADRLMWGVDLGSTGHPSLRSGSG